MQEYVILPAWRLPRRCRLRPLSVAVQQGEDSSRSPELGEDVTHVACNRRRTMHGWRYVLL